MEKRSKLAIFDMDGTLFDTKKVNYRSYCKALEECGFYMDIDYEYFCDFCNGKNYKVFLPVLVPEIKHDEMVKIHDIKKCLYGQLLQYSRMNNHLFSLINLINKEYQIALVTTASKRNVKDILHYYKVKDVFDFVLSQEDVKESKPDPEGFLVAMERAGVTKENTIIFEDSSVGIEAAKRSGANYVKVYGYN